MARIFGQLAAQPYDVFTTLSADRKFKAFATAELDRPTVDITPAFTYSDNRAGYQITAISEGIEIIVLSDEIRQDDVLLDTRTRRVRLVSILIGAFGSANVNDAMIDISNALIKRYKNAPTIETVGDAVSYRGKIGSGEGNVDAYGNFTSGRVLTIKVGQEQFLGDAIDPMAGDAGIPEAPADSKQYVRQNGAWVEVEISGGPQPFYELIDVNTAANVRLSARDGALVVTDPFTESVSQISLGGTTPDPGTLTDVELDGSGRYTVGVNGSFNGNGLVTQEYINTPGQFFVIEDIDGGVFGGGDRQGFGLVRESIYDRTDLDGAPGVFDGGNGGGWSINYVWYYTGGFPYLWTTYADNRQTPGGSGNVATGAMSSQTFQRQWWDLCGRAGVGKKFRVGIANGTLTQQDGANFTNRLVMQLYVAQEMIDHPDAASLLPTSVQTNGAGWYTAVATNGEYEGLGQFPDGKDKGYRFRWSTFGNTTLSQLPYVTGVSDNDQITSASGRSHYIVYNCNATDAAAANATLAQALIGPNNRNWPESTTVDILQFNSPYTFPNTPAENVYDLKYTYLSAVLASPLFNQYQISTLEEITETAQAVAPLEKLHFNVCQEVRQAVTAYYLVRDFDFANTALINTKMFDANQAAVAGQLINTYDAVTNTVPDDGTPEGTGGEVLFPAALKQAILAKLELWMNILPDN